LSVGIKKDTNDPVEPTASSNS